ncbi:MAG: 23S rRNA (pseudouridine(1915)-N(3))-methyltransferase RlmH [Bacteroidales bacterium]
MKVVFLVTGKDAEQWITVGVEKYSGRIGKYVPFEYVVIPEVRQKKTNNDAAVVKEREGVALLNRIQDSDYLVLLDQRGNKHTSESFAEWFQGMMNRSLKRCVFVAGGAWGFSEKVYQRANFMLSLSDMTFNHQVIRIMFLEQMYRALTILRGEPYHHE